MELRCPQCGAENRDDSLDFPLCHQCHEELVRCGQCRHFGRTAPGAMGCVHPTLGGQLNVTATTTPPCGQFSLRSRSLLDVKPLSQVHRAVWVMVIMALLGSVLFAASTLVTRIQPDEQVYFDLMAEAPVTAARGEPFCLNLLAHNQSERSSAEVELLLPQELLQNFRIAAIAPTPIGVEETEQGRCLRYTGVPARGWLDVRLDLLGFRSGTFELRPVLLEEGNIKAHTRLVLTVGR